MSDDLIERLRGPMFKDAGVLEVAVLQAAAKIIEQADEIKRLTQHNIELDEKQISETCACSHDNPGDVCLGHSPTVARQAATIERLREALHWIDNRCPKNLSLASMDRPTRNNAEAMHDAGECARAALGESK